MVTTVTATTSITSTLVLRIKSSDQYKGKYNFNKKYGCHVRQSRSLLALAWAMKMNVVGVSFHVGRIPFNGDVNCFATAIADAFTVFKIGHDLGFNMDILDIGGGYLGVDENNVTFEKVADVVNKSLDQFFPASEGVRVIAEPGRYFVTTAFTLAVNVIAKRVVAIQDQEEDFYAGNQLGESTSSFQYLPCSATIGIKEEDEAKDSYTSQVTHVSRNSSTYSDGDLLLYMYYINDGIYGTFANTKIDKADVWPTVLCRTKDVGSKRSLERQSIIWGPTCNSEDCVVPECRLPDLEVGQWLYFRNMGAYTLSGASNFNSIERPHIFRVCSEHYWNKICQIRSPVPS